MKKRLILLFGLFFLVLVMFGCSLKTPSDESVPEVFSGFKLSKVIFSETDEIEIEVSGYGKGYYLGIFSMISEPGKSGAYKKKSLNDDSNIYIFNASDLRGPGEYQLFLYKKTSDTVIQRETIKIWDNDNTDYVVQNVIFSSSVVDGINSSSIKITPSSNIKDNQTLTYRLYWAKDNVRLSDYRYIKEVQSAKNVEFLVNFNECMYMPSQANQIEVEVLEGKSSSYFISVDDSLKLPESKYLFNFQVVSDIHLDGEFSFTQHTFHLQTAMDEFSNQTDPSKGVFFVGDLSNFGSEGNYFFLKQVFESLKSEKTPNLYFGMGNHECQYYDEYGEALAKFLDFTKRETVNMALTIEGCKFIILGQEDVTTSGTMLQAQVDWFKDEMASANPKEPIFVFMHQPLSQTVNGSFSGQGNSGMGNVSSQLRSILKSYSNVFMFSGHSHRTPDLENTVSYGKGIDATFINTGSLGYLLGLEDVEVGGSSGLFVEVYEDYILVKAKNFVEGKWYASSQYVFPLID